MIDWKNTAKQAYEAYAEVTGWKNYQGKLMPQWEELPETIQGAWIASCKKTWDLLR
ncbi:MAG: hypothetical protein F6K31_31675 [Symploca sp. SIO2G7]|nr:hypothetical protein [Symploca sp. SIO2G7]